MKRRKEMMMQPCTKLYNGLKVAEQHKNQRIECILLAIQKARQYCDSKKLVEQLILPIIISTKQNRVLIFQGSSAFEYTRGYASGQLSLTPNECIQASLNTEGTQFIDSFLTESLLFDNGSFRIN